MRLRQNHAVRATRQFVVLLKPLLVFLKFRRIHKADQRHSPFSFSTAPDSLQFSVRKRGNDTPQDTARQKPTGAAGAIRSMRGPLISGSRDEAHCRFMKRK